MKRFLKYLLDEILGNIPVHSVRDGSQWYRALTELNITHISEVDCKDQF